MRIDSRIRNKQSRSVIRLCCSGRLADQMSEKRTKQNAKGALYSSSTPSSLLIKAPQVLKLKGHANMFGDLRNRQETCSNAQSVCVRPRQENTKYSFASLLAIGCLVFFLFFFTLARHLFDGSTANQGRLDDYQGGTVRICVL